MLLFKYIMVVLKFFVRTKENYFGGATENDFDNLENFYFFLKEKIEK